MMTEKIKIHLVAINPEPYSLAISYLHAALKKDPNLDGRVEVSQFIFDWEKVSTPYYDLTSLISKVLGNKPDIIGFSTYLWNVELLKYLVQILKSIQPHLQFIIGGPEVESLVNTGWRDLPVGTFLVIGEGEAPLCKIVRAILGGNTENLPANSVLRTANGLLFGPKSGRMSIKDIPSPVIEGTLLTDAIDWIPAYATSRGCPNHCAYCHWHDGKGHRLFPLKQILKELRLLSEKNLHRIWFVDTCFGKELERDCQILDFLATWPSECSFCFETHPQHITKKLAEGFSRLNIGWVALGVESLNPRALVQCNRYTNRETIFRAIKMLSETLPKPENIHIDLIFGLPGDTVADIIYAIDQIKNAFPLVTIFFEVLKVLPGSLFHQRARKDKWVTHRSIGMYDLISMPEFSWDSLLRAKEIGIGIDFLQFKDCRLWADTIFTEMNVPYSRLALCAGKILHKNGLDYHHEYNRQFWFDELFEDKRLMESLQKEIVLALKANKSQDFYL